MGGVKKRSFMFLSMVILMFGFILLKPELNVFAADTGTVGGSADFSSNDASTKIYLTVGDDAKKNLSASIPVKVVLALCRNAGQSWFWGPSPDAYKIANTGVIDFYVSNISVTFESGYNVVPFLTGFDKEDVLGGRIGSCKNTSAGEDLNQLSDLAVGKGNDKTNPCWNAEAGGSIPVLISGSTGYFSKPVESTVDKATHIFDITYTITAGKIAK